MTFFDAVALSFVPVLVAILAAALILPRAWLASYAAFVIVAAILYADLNGRTMMRPSAVCSRCCSACWCWRRWPPASPRAGR